MFLFKEDYSVKLHGSDLEILKQKTILRNIYFLATTGANIFQNILIFVYIRKKQNIKMNVNNFHAQVFA